MEKEKIIKGRKVEEKSFKIATPACQSYANIALRCNCGNGVDIIWDENKFTMMSKM